MSNIGTKGRGSVADLSKFVDLHSDMSAVPNCPYQPFFMGLNCFGSLNSFKNLLFSYFYSFFIDIYFLFIFIMYFIIL